ncbi:tRNA nucleotidyltransferase [Pseudodesulfovibrio sp. JC047]|uniref:tRNA nucleotidyltransferase n=1 Tax=Pseudodesulfovibrio sp. JC047 TaxID=2683199 RepID=UPI0013D86940|nr:tRNA nucleotidyltransferase [Pseudodesulfovibrio sp. JC047]NDV19092.1 tRNA nucleotidyltransferase [Pseudodesulfovibrio sp. JC047]
MHFYLAGGAVRDLLLGRPIHDRDYLVTGTSRDDFTNAFPKAHEIGLAFPIFMMDGLEFSFPRAETLLEELKARDLTVNALLLDDDGELICHPHGLDDLNNAILRPASHEAFHIDPLRVYRAARFWAQLPDFTPHMELKDTMRAVAKTGLLATLSPERVGQELIKALSAPAPGNFLRLLAETDCLSPWFEEFYDAATIPAGPAPYHDTHVLEHTCRTMDSLAGDPMTVWMGLCHDIGKTATPKDRLPHHYGHDRAGIPRIKTLVHRLKLSNRHLTAGIKAAQWHMIAARYEELRAGTKVDLLMDTHLSETLEPLFALVLVDQDKDYRSRAQRNLATILKVKLKPEDRNLGAKSGEKLRTLRAHALTRRSRQ